MDYLSLLTAEVQYTNARLGYIQAQARRYLDTVGLFVALGGNWHKRAPAGARRPPAAPGGKSKSAREN